MPPTPSVSRAHRLGATRMLARGQKIELCGVPEQVCIGARSVLTCPGDVLRGFEEVQSIHSGGASMVRSGVPRRQLDGSE